MYRFFKLIFHESDYNISVSAPFVKSRLKHFLTEFTHRFACVSMRGNKHYHKVRKYHSPIWDVTYELVSLIREVPLNVGKNIKTEDGN